MLSFKLIVVPTDFSVFSLNALKYAVGLAQQSGAELKIIYVNQPSLAVSDMAWVGVDQTILDVDHITMARRNLEKIALENVPLDQSADAEMLTGDPVEQIVGYAREIEADLIVMATHGRTGISHALMGSTAEQVVRRAHCPVLTLKQEEDDHASQRICLEDHDNRRSHCTAGTKVK